MTLTRSRDLAAALTAAQAALATARDYADDTSQTYDASEQEHGVGSPRTRAALDAWEDADHALTDAKRARDAAEAALAEAEAQTGAEMVTWKATKTALAAAMCALDDAQDAVHHASFAEAAAEGAYIGY